MSALNIVKKENWKENAWGWAGEGEQGARALAKTVRSSLKKSFPHRLEC